MPDTEDLFDLKGRVAVVTGAGRGLGQALAQSLARAGASLVLFDVDFEAVQQVADELSVAGGRALALKADVADPDQVRPALERAESTIGPVTILVNNAGITSNSPFEDLPARDWERVLQVNLGGIFNVTQAVGAALIKRSLPGSIVNIASISGIVGNRGGNNSHYCAAKGGVIALTRSLAVEWAPHRIRVNAIAPGYFVTPMTDQLKARDARFYAELVNRVPLGRFGQGSDLAGAVIFLASDASGFVTGHTLVVDGGYTAW